MARFEGLGLDPILADSDDDDGDMGFRRSGFGVRGGDDRRGRGGGNDAVSALENEKKRLLLFVPPGPIGSLSWEGVRCWQIKASAEVAWRALR